MKHGFLCYFDTPRPRIPCACGGVITMRYTEYMVNPYTELMKSWVWLACDGCHATTRDVQGMGMDIDKELEAMTRKEALVTP